MKTLLITLAFLPIMAWGLTGCKGSLKVGQSDTVYIYRKSNHDSVTYTVKPIEIILKKGDSFWFGYSDQDVTVFTVKDANKYGVYVNGQFGTRYINYHDLNRANFKQIK